MFSEYRVVKSGSLSAKVGYYFL